MPKSGLIELEAVLAVARHRSFRAASRELEMSSSALSNAVAGLEERLGVRLFNRTTRSVGLTEAGQHFVEQVAPALSDIRSAMDVANGWRDKPIGTLRINSSVGAVRQILAPIIAEYLHRYPEMNVDIVTEGRLVDIVVDEFDAGIRLADAVPRDMVSVPLGPKVRFAVVGSPDYFKTREIPEKPGDLMAHECIRARMPSGVRYCWEFGRRGESIAIDVPGRLTLDDPTLMLEAARSGAGLAHLAGWDVAQDIQAGRLIEVLGDWMPSFPGLCLYYPGRRHVPAGLRALVELVKELKQPLRRNDEAPKLC